MFPYLSYTPLALLKRYFLQATSSRHRFPWACPALQGIRTLTRRLRHLIRRRRFAFFLVGFCCRQRCSGRCDSRLLVLVGLELAEIGAQQAEDVDGFVLVDIGAQAGGAAPTHHEQGEALVNVLQDAAAHA